MQIQDLLTPERTFIAPSGITDKAGLLQHLAGLAGAPGCNLDETAALEAFKARERLGSTGIGEGVAIPHCRLDCCDQPRGILLRLNQAIDFGSLDGHPVDLVFALLTPADNADIHLRVLSHLAALFNEAEYRLALRQAETAEALYQQATLSPIEQPLSADT